jgi:hypothetical protein
MKKESPPQVVEKFAAMLREAESGAQQRLPMQSGCASHDFVEAIAFMHGYPRQSATLHRGIDSAASNRTDNPDV